MHQRIRRIAGAIAVLGAAVLGVAATSASVNASGPHPAAAGDFTLVTNFGSFGNYADNAGTIHWNTPNPGPGNVTSASVVRPGNVVQVWNGVNGAGLIATCPSGLHWVSNNSNLVISSCATVTTTTTTTTTGSSTSTTTTTTLESTTTAAGATTTGGEATTTTPGTGTVTAPVEESTTTAAGSSGGSTATSTASGGPVPAAPGGLPSTGSTSVPFVLLALGVLLAGLGLRLLGRAD